MLAKWSTNVWGQTSYIMEYISILTYQIFACSIKKNKGNAFLTVHYVLSNSPGLISYANKITDNSEKKHWIEFFSRQSVNEGSSKRYNKILYPLGIALHKNEVFH